MAEPVPFRESNRTLTAPPGPEYSDVCELPIFCNGQVCISKWRLTEAEIAEIIRTKHVWIHVWSGETQPPIAVGAERPFQ